MFERFTDHARRTLVLAQNEARERRHSRLGTEDLLIALMMLEDDIPARALVKLGVPLETARENVEKLLIPTEIQPYRGDAPFTEDAKKSLELALRAALQFGHHFIGTEHLLLGIIRWDDEMVNAVYGVKPDAVRETVSHLIIERDGLRTQRAIQPEEPAERSSAAISTEIEALNKKLRKLVGELADAIQREADVPPSDQH